MTHLLSALASRRRFAAIALLGASFAWLPAATQDESDLRPDLAVELYDDGKYEEARAILEELAVEGELSGELLYRLAYCRRLARDPDGERAALQQAVADLEERAGSSATLEAPFYLVNAYRNLGLSSQARDAARAATERVESGALARPTQPMEMFRLAKLYADQSRPTEAIEWYHLALAAFEASENAYPENVAWAHGYLGDVAYSRGDYATAEAEYAATERTGRATTADYDRLATARARLGMWRPAAQAWRTAEKMDPANANRARYCGQLARLAATLEPLPENPPSGGAWGALSRGDLEALMAEQTGRVKEAIASVQSGEVTDEAGRRELEARIAAAKPIFVKAALEYAMRRFPIRETAFTGGYAPMIFRAGTWELPPAE